jgi:hypothetical protein
VATRIVEPVVERWRMEPAVVATSRVRSSLKS